MALILAVEQGDEIAQFDLADLLFHDRNALKGKDAWQGILVRIENPSFKKAQFTMGRLFYRGGRSTQDFQSAIQWFRISADNGHALAQYALGMINALGHGVDPDLIKARAWFGKACKQGFEQSCRAYQSLEDQEALEEDLKHEWLVLSRSIRREVAPF